MGLRFRVKGFWCLRLSEFQAPGLKIGLIGSRSGAFGSRAFGSRDVRLLGLVLWVQVLGFRV